MFGTDPAMERRRRIDAIRSRNQQRAKVREGAPPPPPAFLAGHKAVACSSSSSATSSNTAAAVTRKTHPATKTTTPTTDSEQRRDTCSAPLSTITVSPLTTPATSREREDVPMRRSAEMEGIRMEKLNLAELRRGSFSDHFANCYSDEDEASVFEETPEETYAVTNRSKMNSTADSERVSTANRKGTNTSASDAVSVSSDGINAKENIGPHPATATGLRNKSGALATRVTNKLLRVNSSAGSESMVSRKPATSSSTATVASGAGGNASWRPGIAAKVSNYSSTSGSAAVKKNSSQALSNTSVVLSKQAAKPVSPTVIPPASSSSFFAFDIYDLLDQMEAVMTFVDDVTEGLAQRTRSLPPPASLQAFRASITPARGPSRGRSVRASSGVDDTKPDPLLVQLHDAAQALLSAFSRLECPKLPTSSGATKATLASSPSSSSSADVMKQLELDCLAARASVCGQLDLIDRKFSTSAEPSLREAFAERSGALADCRAVVDAVMQTAQVISLLRVTVEQQDLFRVREVYEDHKAAMLGQKPQQEQQQEQSPSSAPPLGERARRLRTAFAKGPFFTWLEQRWMPAMRSWRRIVLCARERASSTGNIDEVLASAQAEALAISDLQEILKPGQTLSDLHAEQVEQSVRQLGRKYEEQATALAALRSAMSADRLTVPDVAAAMEAAQAFMEADSGARQQRDAEVDVSDAKGRSFVIIEEAQRLIADLQQADTVYQGMQVAHTAKCDAVHYFQVIHRANELIHRLQIASSPAHAQRIVRACRLVMESINDAMLSSSRSVAGAIRTSHSIDTERRSSGSPQQQQQQQLILADFLPSTLSVHDVCLVHTPSKVWSADMTTLYQSVCRDLAQAYMMETVRGELLRAVEALSQADSRGLSSPDGTMIEDDASSHLGRRSASALVTANEEIRACLRRAEELGLSGPLVDRARARLTRMRTLRIKVRCRGGANTRLVALPDPEFIDFADIYARLFAVCEEEQEEAKEALGEGSGVLPLGTKLRIRYRDLDGDHISIFNAQDWATMLNEITTAGAVGGTKVDLDCDFITPGIAGKSSASTTPHKASGAAAPPDTLNLHQRLLQKKEGEGQHQVPAPHVSDTRSPAVCSNHVKVNSGGANVSGAGRPVPVPRTQRTLGSGDSPFPGTTRAAQLREAQHQQPQQLRRMHSTQAPLRRGAPPGGAVAPRRAATPLQPRSRAQQQQQQQEAQLASRGMGLFQSSLRSSGSGGGRTAASLIPSNTLTAKNLDAIQQALRNERAKAHHDEGRASVVNSVVHLDMKATKRWVEEESLRLEIQTVASMSTVRPGRGNPFVTESMERGLESKSASLYPRSAGVTAAAAAGASNNTTVAATVKPSGSSSSFTVTNCRNSSTVQQRQQHSGNPGTSLSPSSCSAAVKNNITNKNKNVHAHCLPAKPSIAEGEEHGGGEGNTSPRRWTTFNDFSMDEIKSVASEPSAIPRQRMMIMPEMPREDAKPQEAVAAPATLPPKPVSAQVDRKARQTPLRRRGSRVSAEDEDAAATQHRDPDAMLEEMSRLKAENKLAMALHSKPVWR